MPCFNYIRVPGFAHAVAIKHDVIVPGSQGQQLPESQLGIFASLRAFGSPASARVSRQIPRDANGSYIAAVMVEEGDPLKKKPGVQLDARYAVIVSLGVNGVSHSRTITEIKDVALHNEKDRVFVQAAFSNRGKTDGTLNAELQMRDARNRLVQKVNLKTQSAWERGDAGSRVFPGSQVLVFGEVPRSLPAGDYQVEIHDRFGDHAQPLFRGTLNLPADQFAAALPVDPATAANSGMATNTAHGRLARTVSSTGEGMADTSDSPDTF